MSAFDKPGQASDLSKSKEAAGPNAFAQFLGDVGDRKSQGAFSDTLNHVQEANAQMLSPQAKLMHFGSAEQQDKQVQAAGFVAGKDIEPVANNSSDTSFDAAKFYAQADLNFDAKVNQQST